MLEAGSFLFACVCGWGVVIWAMDQRNPTWTFAIYIAVLLSGAGLLLFAAHTLWMGLAGLLTGLVSHLMFRSALAAHFNRPIHPRLS